MGQVLVLYLPQPPLAPTAPLHYSTQSREGLLENMQNVTMSYGEGQADTGKIVIH